VSEQPDFSEWTTELPDGQGKGARPSAHREPLSRRPSIAPDDCILDFSNRFSRTHSSAVLLSQPYKWFLFPLTTNYDNGLILPENSNLGFLRRQLTSVIVAPSAENKRLIGKSALRTGREIHILLTLKTPENSLSPII
jgi:hypothetical protein